jgi:hypothetical protein
MSNWTQLIKTYFASLIAKWPDPVSSQVPTVDAGANASLSSIESAAGAGTDAPASVSVDEDTTSRSIVGLLKGAKNLLIDAVGHLATIAGCISGGSLSIHLGETLSYLLDSIDVAKMSKGAVTIVHSAITGTATSAEVDCRGFNSLLVHFVSSATDKTWTLSITGAMGSGLTFVPLLDKTTGLAASEITTDISGWFVISNIPDYVKIVATVVDDGATVTVKVQPFNG